MPDLIVNLRNGAILATLCAIPVLVGLAWNTLWGEPETISPGAIGVIIFAWIAAAGVVAALSINAARDANTLGWFYPCTNCRQRVAIFSYRCSHCKTKFAPPLEAHAFRRILLVGTAVFYVIFLVGGFVTRL